MGLPVAEFVAKTWPSIVSQTDHIIVGSIGSEKPFLDAVHQRREQFDILSDLMLRHFQL